MEFLDAPNRPQKRYGPSNKLDRTLIYSTGTGGGSTTQWIYSLAGDGTRTAFENELFHPIKSWTSHRWMESVLPHVQEFLLVPVTWTKDGVIYDSGHIKVNLDISLLDKNDSVLGTASNTLEVNSIAGSGYDETIEMYVENGNHSSSCSAWSYSLGGGMVGVEKIKIEWSYAIQESLADGTIISSNTNAYASINAGVYWAPYARWNKWRLTE